MDMHGLQAFVEVARQGSFSGAAESLFVTQPAISKRVKALEDELGTLLFDRIGRKTTLTEAGRALLESGLKSVYHVGEGFEGDLDDNHQRGTVGGWRYHKLPWEQC
jgi:DNA-binding transcriptional LysR family regulator